MGFFGKVEWAFFGTPTSTDEKLYFERGKIMFCSRCGKEIDDEAVVCVHCGCAVNSKPATGVGDAPNTGYAILGFLLPIVGLILYLVNKDTYPLKARSAGKGALIGVILGVVFYIIYIVFIVALGISAAGYGY